MQRLLISAFLLGTLTLGSYIAPASAIGRRSISTDVAERGFTIRLAKGVGVVISFIPSGETIVHAWLSDPSKVVLTSNGSLCPAANGSGCQGGRASVLYLKPIVPLHFSGMYRSGDGSSLLSVIATGAGGDRLYQFRLVVSDGSPEYTALEVGGTPSFKPLPPSIPTTVAKMPAPPPTSSEDTLIPPPITQEVTPSTVRGKAVPKRSPSLSSVYVITQPPSDAGKDGTTETTPPPKSVAKPKEKAPSEAAPQIHDNTAIASSPNPIPSPKADGESNSQVTDTPQPIVSKTEKIEEIKPKDMAILPAKSTAPDANKPESASNSGDPVLDSDASAKKSPPASTIPTHIELANTLARGLPVGVSSKQIGRWSNTFYKVQSAIGKLRRGRVTTIDKAASAVGLNESVLSQIYKWGGGM